MSVYAGEKKKNLIELFESIKKQSLQHDEFIIIIDGKISDILNHVIYNFSKLDKKTKIFHLEKNNGLAKALNFGLSKVSYEIVLRCDSDDIYLPDRNKYMLNLFKLFPNLVLAGSYVEEFQDDNNYKFIRKVPINMDLVKKNYVLANPFNHPSIAFKKSIILKIGGYPELYPEDWLLWGEIINLDYEICNLPIVLVKMRVGKEFQKRRGIKQIPGEIRAVFFGIKNFFSIKTFFLGIFSIMVRILIRLAPIKLRTLIYYIRK